jgi:hypothetical protein
MGGTTIEALTYLHELPRCDVSIFRSGNPQIIFHSKVYVFDGPDGWIAFVGSGNMSAGGLHANAEASLRLDGRTGEANPAAAYLDELTSSPSLLRSHHVQPLDRRSLAELATVLPQYTQPPPDRGDLPGGPSDPLELTVPLPPTGRPPAPSVREIPRVTTAKRRFVEAPAGKSSLYMELWSETGGGTQVQIPKVAFQDFFGAGLGGLAIVHLRVPGSSRPLTIRLQDFSNSTFRIPLRFLKRTPRPAVLRFARTGQDSYTVSVATKADPNYRPWLAKCTERTSSRSKRYGIERN